MFMSNFISELKEIEGCDPEDDDHICCLCLQFEIMRKLIIVTRL